MKSEEWIRERIEGLKESKKHRGNDYLDRLLAACENGQISVLEEILEE